MQLACRKPRLRSQRVALSATMLVAVVEDGPAAFAALHGLFLAVLVGREVDRCCLDGSVAEEHADVGDVDALGAQQLGGARVAQRVRVAQVFGQLGRRRRDGTYTRVGARCGQAVLAAILKRLGAAAELPDELRHPPALRHTCATELLRTEGVNVADVRVFLGHASVKTTSIYLASDEDRQEQAVQRRERGRPTLDDDRDA